MAVVYGLALALGAIVFVVMVALVYVGWATIYGSRAEARREARVAERERKEMNKRRCPSWADLQKFYATLLEGEDYR